MRYFELHPADPTLDADLFREDDAKGRRALRAMYQPFACAKCGKVDELRALAESGLPALALKLRRAYSATADDFPVCDRAFVDAIRSAGITGLEFLPFASGGFVVLPTDRRPVELAKAQIRPSGSPCATCGRPRETSVGPLCESVEKPDDAMAIFSPAAWPESVLGTRPMLLCAEPVKKALAAMRLRGLELVEAL